MAIGTPTHLTSGYGTTTASISPTSGSRIFAAVWANDTDTTDPHSITEGFTVSGLSGTWVRMEATMFRAFSSSVNSAATIFYCDDHTGSGALTLAHTGAGTVTDFYHSVFEITGASTSVPYMGLTHTPDGYAQVSNNDAWVLNIGDDTAETPPTNAICIAVLFEVEVTNTTGLGYDSTNWTLLNSLAENVDSNRFLHTLYSTNGDLTPALVAGSISAAGGVAIGFIVPEAGNEPTEWHEPVLRSNELLYADGQNVTSSPMSDVFVRVTQGGGSGRAQLDNHNDHGPTRVIDMTNVGYERAMHVTQVGDDDHWVAAKWFQDVESATAATNEFHLELRHDGTGSTHSGYVVRFMKSGGASIDIMQIRIDERTSGTSTTVATLSDFEPTPNELDAVAVYAEIKGSVIKVYVEGVLKLTHDTTGDSNVHTTGQYVGWEQWREHSSLNSQPFFYNWQAGLFTTAGSPPVGQPAYLGDSEVLAVKLGDLDVTKMYLGDVLVFE